MPSTWTPRENVLALERRNAAKLTEAEADKAKVAFLRNGLETLRGFMDVGTTARHQIDKLLRESA